MKEISIIIIVKNDRGISDTLKSLLLIHTPKRIEIIVVDGSNGGLHDIRNKYLSKVSWIVYANKKRKRITIAEQRNVGLKQARGKIIIFIDANCVPSKDWLYELVKPLYEENEDIVSGATFSLNGVTLHDETVEHNRDKVYLDECATINLAFKKEILLSVGCFDETFDYGSDVDFIWRARNAGYKVRYNKKAVIRHDWGGYKQEIVRFYRYGKARARLYIKHLNRWRLLFSKDFLVICYSLFLIFLPLIFIMPYYPLLLLIPLIKNWNNKPFWVVMGHLIYAAGFIAELIQHPLRYVSQ